MSLGLVAIIFFFVLISALVLYFLRVVHRRLALADQPATLRAVEIDNNPVSSALDNLVDEVQRLGFLRIGQIVIEGEGRSPFGEQNQTIFLAPSRTAFLTAGVVDKKMTAGLFSLFAEEACVETLLLDVPKRATPRIDEPTHRMRVYTGSFDVENVVHYHYRQVEKMKRNNLSPTKINALGDVVHLTNTYIQYFMPRRTLIALKPISISTSILAGFNVILGLLLARNLSVLFGQPIWLPALAVGFSSLSVILLAFSIAYSIQLRRRLKQPTQD